MLFGRSKRSADDGIGGSDSTAAPRRRSIDEQIRSGAPVSKPPLVSVGLDVTWEHSTAPSVPDSAILEHVSSIIMATVRTTDIVYRQGHAQFCVLLSSTRPEDSGTVVERIRSQIEASKALSGFGIKVGISVDGTGVHAPGSPVDASVDRAIDAIDAIDESGSGRTQPGVAPIGAPGSGTPGHVAPSAHDSSNEVGPPMTPLSGPVSDMLPD